VKILKAKSILLLITIFLTLIYSFNFAFAGDNDHQILGWVKAEQNPISANSLSSKLEINWDSGNVNVFWGDAGKVSMITLTNGGYNDGQEKFTLGDTIHTQVQIKNEVRAGSTLIAIIALALIIAGVILTGGALLGVLGIAPYSAGALAVALMGVGGLATLGTGAAISLTNWADATYALEGVKVCNEIWLDTADASKLPDPLFSCTADGEPANKMYYRQCKKISDEIKIDETKVVDFTWPGALTTMWKDNFLDKPGSSYMQKSYFCVISIKKDLPPAGGDWPAAFWPNINLKQEEITYCQNLKLVNFDSKNEFTENPEDPYTSATPRPEDKAFGGIYCDTKFRLERVDYKGYITQCTPDKKASEKKSYNVGETATFTITASNAGNKQWVGGNPSTDIVYDQNESYTKYGTQKDKTFLALGTDGEYRWGLSLQAPTSQDKTPTVTKKVKVKFSTPGTYSFLASVIRNDEKISEDYECDSIEVKLLPECSGSISAVFTGDGKNIIIAPNTTLPYDGKVTSKEMKSLANRNPQIYVKLLTDPNCDQKITEQSIEVSNDSIDLNTEDPKFVGEWDPVVINSLFSSCEDQNKCCYVQEVGFCADDCVGDKELRCDERSIAKTSLSFQILEGATTTTSGTTGPSETTSTSSTTTTSSSTSTSTTTTTTPLPEWNINCGDCEVGQNCTCFLQGAVCTNGTWIVKNSQATPIVPFSMYIPPQFVNFTPTSTGKVEVVATCFQPFEKVVSQLVEVKPEFMQCPSECSVAKECRCNITGCSAGLFQVNKTEGNPLSGVISISITSTQFVATFTPTGNGKVEATAACTNPIKMAKKNITITGEVPIGNFTGKSFTCVQMTGGYKCTLIYNNTLNSNAKVLFLFSDDRDAVISSVGPAIAGQGSGSLDAIFSCTGLPKEPIYYASWNAYLDADTRLANPIAYSKSNEVVPLRC